MIVFYKNYFVPGKIRITKYSGNGILEKKNANIRTFTQIKLVGNPREVF